MSVVLALAGCGRGPAVEAPAPAPPRTLRFAPAEPVPVLAASPRATVDGVDVPIGYHLIYRSGDSGFGTIYNPDGTENVARPCGDQDANSLLATGDRAWLVSHFECVPGAMYLTELAQDAEGLLTPITTAPVDWSPFGSWNPCAGMASPWGTHIGSEEYEPDAASWNPADGTLPEGLAEMATALADPTEANPYAYGWPTEVRVTDGRAEPQRHYAMGRFSHELSYVLPDARTVYQSDDGGNTGLFLFVADRAGDLAAGALYAAALAQEGEELAISWVPLGSATDAEIRSLIDARVEFGDLFERVAPEGTACPAGFTSTRHTYGRECLKLREPSARVADPARAASRLETRRYAAMRGATTELNKGEGLSFDPESGRVFLALSAHRGGMLAEPGEPIDSLQLPANQCGAVWAIDTAGEILDRDGRPIDSANAGIRMRPEVVGIPLLEPNAAGNHCEPTGIANPDNLTLLGGYGVLVIAEDTPFHTNAVLWSYDLRSKELVPILIAPPGGQVTGIQWVADLLGHGYLTAVIQHPEGVTADDQRAYTGYIGPFPPLR
jgi:uncharacterized protein